MLSDYTPMPTLATADPQRSRAFYEGVLGFPPGEAGGDGVVYRAGAGSFLVYESSFAGTNQATAMSLQCDAGFDDEVRALRDAGVQFDTFDYEGIEWQDGVAVMGESKSVWFKDPDGNIINVMASA